MCGIFGAIRTKNTEIGEKRFKHLIRNLGVASQIRGTDATGIAFNDANEHLNIIKAAIPAASFPFIKSIPNNTHAVIGHVRLTTQGTEKRNFNNHPFLGRVKKQQRKFAMAHNGMFYNDTELQKLYGLSKTKIETDSYVAVQMLEQTGKLNFKNLKSVAEELQGSFMLTFLEERTNDLWLVKGNNPIYLVHFKELGLIAYASTKQILHEALKQDKMLWLYYNACVDKFDLNRVDIILCNDGDIIHFDYNKKKFNKSDFDTSNIWGSYNWNYSCGYNCNYKYNDDDDFWWEKDIKNNTSSRYGRTTSSTESTFLLPEKASVSQCMWETIECIFTNEELLCYYAEDGRIDVIGTDGKHYTFIKYEDFKDFAVAFEDYGFNYAKNYIMSRNLNKKEETTEEEILY